MRSSVPPGFPPGSTPLDAMVCWRSLKSRGPGELEQNNWKSHVTRLTVVVECLEDLFEEKPKDSMSIAFRTSQNHWLVPRKFPRQFPRKFPRKVPRVHPRKFIRKLPRRFPRRSPHKLPGNLHRKLHRRPSRKLLPRIPSKFPLKRIQPHPQRHDHNRRHPRHHHHPYNHPSRYLEKLATGSITHLRHVSVLRFMLLSLDLGLMPMQTFLDITLEIGLPWALMHSLALSSHPSNCIQPIPLHPNTIQFIPIHHNASQCIPRPRAN